MHKTAEIEHFKKEKLCTLSEVSPFWKSRFTLTSPSLCEAKQIVQVPGDRRVEPTKRCF